MKDRTCRSCGKKRTPGARFHRFPVNRPEVYRRWIINAKLPDFIPTVNDILCSDHFDKAAYIYSDGHRLHEDAVPTIFAHNKAVERKIPMKRSPPTIDTDEEEKPPKIKRINASPTKEELKAMLLRKDQELNTKRKEIKSLKQIVRRKTSQVTTLQSLVNDIKERELMAPSIADCLASNFSGLTGELISNHFSNMDRSRNGVRYTPDVKKFALTLHFYSPRAYDYVRQSFCLPDPRSIRVWTSTVRCEPGFFKDVFEHLKNLVEQDQIRNEDVALIFDGMAIKQGVVNNPSKGCMECFVDLGEGIIGCADDGDEDTIATEGLIFMLSALRSFWKFAIGYVLINKIDAITQKCLVERGLELAKEVGLRVRTLTCDGTKTNLSTMKKFGCKTGGKREKELSGSFTYDGERYLYTPDPPHMLKLGRNALSHL